MSERKGVFTEPQEKQLDRLIEFKNKFAESVDGPAIKVIDNQAIEAAKKQIPEQYWPQIYNIVDIIMDGLKALEETEEA